MQQFGLKLGDHLARAREFRSRATQCGLSAKDCLSPSFRSCYILLAKNYEGLAKLEEEFVERETRHSYAAAEIVGTASH